MLEFDISKFFKGWCYDKGKSKFATVKWSVEFGRSTEEWKKVDCLKVEIFSQVTDNNKEFRIFYNEIYPIVAGYNHYPVHLTFTDYTKIMFTVMFANILQENIFRRFQMCFLKCCAFNWPQFYQFQPKVYCRKTKKIFKVKIIDIKNHPSLCKISLWYCGILS